MPVVRALRDVLHRRCEALESEQTLREMAVSAPPSPTWLGAVAGAALGALATACGGGNTDEARLPAVDDPICPVCKPVSGGQTSDFDGGTPHPCSQFLVERAADENSLADRGFALEALEGSMNREIDAPLDFELGDPRDSGARVTGFDEATRVVGTTSALSFSYFAIDEDLCDATLCRTASGSHEVATTACREQEHVKIRFEAHLSTSDGAMAGVLRGDAFLWQSAVYPVGSALADINDVSGSLRLTLPDDGTFSARWRADVYFTPHSVGGLLDVDLRRVRDGSAAEYLLLSGYWPERLAQGASSAPTGSE